MNGGIWSRPLDALFWHSEGGKEEPPPLPGIWRRKWDKGVMLHFLFCPAESRTRHRSDQRRGAKIEIIS